MTAEFDLVALKSWQLRIPVYEADGVTPRSVASATCAAYLRVAGSLLAADVVAPGSDGVSFEATWNEERIPHGRGVGEVAVRYAENDHQGTVFNVTVAQNVVPA
ncbi:MAG: hypothetical protein MUE98_00135 [Rhodobacteraceae bacterium]|jgi:hypothetical protein|nr:hypothetical protein [Paracoccaceae bacterium]